MGDSEYASNDEYDDWEREYERAVLGGDEQAEVSLSLSQSLSPSLKAAPVVVALAPSPLRIAEREGGEEVEEENDYAEEEFFLVSPQKETVTDRETDRDRDRETYGGSNIDRGLFSLPADIQALTDEEMLAQARAHSYSHDDFAQDEEEENSPVKTGEDKDKDKGEEQHQEEEEAIDYDDNIDKNNNNTDNINDDGNNNNNDNININSNEANNNVTDNDNSRTSALSDKATQKEPVAIQTAAEEGEKRQDERREEREEEEERTTARESSAKERVRESPTHTHTVPHTQSFALSASTQYALQRLLSLLSAQTYNAQSANNNNTEGDGDTTVRVRSESDLELLLRDCCTSAERLREREKERVAHTASSPTRTQRKYTTAPSPHTPHTTQKKTSKLRRKLQQAHSASRRNDEEEDKEALFQEQRAQLEKDRERLNTHTQRVEESLRQSLTTLALSPPLHTPHTSQKLPSKSQSQTQSHTFLTQTSQQQAQTTQDTQQAHPPPLSHWEHKCQRLLRKLRRETQEKRAYEEYLKTQNRKLKVLLEHVEKLMRVLKIENTKKIQVIGECGKKQKECDIWKERYEKQMKITALQTRALEEVRQGSKVLEDQLALMDEKFFELRAKLDFSREFFAKTMRRVKKENEELRKKYTYATGEPLLDRVRLPAEEGGKGGRQRPLSTNASRNDDMVDAMMFSPSRTMHTTGGGIPFDMTFSPTQAFSREAESEKERDKDRSRRNTVSFHAQHTQAPTETLQRPQSAFSLSSQAQQSTSTRTQARTQAHTSQPLPLALSVSVSQRSQSAQPVRPKSAAVHSQHSMQRERERERHAQKERERENPLNTLGPKEKNRALSFLLERIHTKKTTKLSEKWTAEKLADLLQG